MRPTYSTFSDLEIFIHLWVLLLLSLYSSMSCEIANFSGITHPPSIHFYYDPKICCISGSWSSYRHFITKFEVISSFCSSFLCSCRFPYSSCSRLCLFYNKPYPICRNPCFSSSFSSSSFSKEAFVLGFLKVTNLVVGLPIDATGDLVLALGGVNSSISPSLGLIYSFLLGDSSIMIGKFGGYYGFPFLIMALFLVLKYMGTFLYCFLLGFREVPNVANVVATLYSVSPGDRLV